MRNTRLSAGVVSFMALLGMLAAAGPEIASAQADPHIGTWVLNVAKSKYAPGPGPKEQTSVYAMAGQGIKVSTKAVGADGKPTMTEFTAMFDGKDHPVTGNADYDATMMKRVDSNTIEFTRKKGGKMVQTATSAVSKDGKTRTVTTTGVNAQGQKINNVTVFEKK
jgi:hypothetical protein